MQVHFVGMSIGMRIKVEAFGCVLDYWGRTNIKILELITTIFIKHFLIIVDG